MNNLKTTILALCLTLTSFIPCFAQETEEADSSINVIAYFSKNDTTEYRETHLKYQIRDKDTIYQNAYYEDYALIVKDSTASDYTIECISKDFQLLTMEQSFGDKLTKIIWDITKNVPLLIKVDSLGSLKGIVNWKEYRDKVQPAFKVACEMLKGDLNENIINIPGLIVTFNQMTNTEEAIINATTITSKLFSLHGCSFSFGETKSKGETLGYPTDITAQTSVHETASKEGDPEIANAGDYDIQVVSQTKMPVTKLTDLGLDIAQQTMTETSASMIDEAKSKLKEEIKGLGDATITVNENYSYFVNGWPKYISEEKIFDINEAKVVTSFEIEWTNIRWQ